jgi:hypothetical protein
VQQLAAILSMALAGFLASTVLRGFHGTVAGLTFGPYDTIFIFAGLLFVLAGLGSIAPLRDVTDTTSQPGPEAEVPHVSVGENEAGTAPA